MYLHRGLTEDLLLYKHTNSRHCFFITVCLGTSKAELRNQNIEYLDRSRFVYQNVVVQYTLAYHSALTLP